MRQVLLIAVALLTATDAAAINPNEYCRREVDRRIDHIEARLRAGYSASQGNAWKKDRSVLREVRYQCDRNPNAWRQVAAWPALGPAVTG